MVVLDFQTTFDQKRVRLLTARCALQPYGIDKKIVHLVVWTKFALKSDPRTGDLTDQARKEIADYVEEAFARKMGKENVSCRGCHGMSIEREADVTAGYLVQELEEFAVTSWSGAFPCHVV